MEAEVGEGEAGLGLVQDPHDDLLAVDGRQRRHPEVDPLAGDVQGDAAVLGDATLGDVDVGHDLEAADHPALDGAGRVHDLVEHAVDPEADAQVGLGRLDVDVRRPVGHRLGDQQVDELDDRGVLDGLPGDALVFVVGQLLGGDLGHLVDLGVEAVEPVDGLGQLGPGGHDDLDLGAGDGPQVVDGQDVAGIGHGHQQPVVGPGHRQGEEAAGHGLGEEGDRTPVDGVLGQVDELQAELAGQRPHEDGLRDGAVLHQELADREAPLRLGFQGRVELGLGDQALGQQHLAERLAEEQGGSRARKRNVPP